ncbi:hypothetical protein BC628DRAFT_504830 [Trametes gibbosa]|nr:hypothetical protein BC628DRAFT_504830 [Trametes gibbosa]
MGIVQRLDLGGMITTRLRDLIELLSHYIPRSVAGHTGLPCNSGHASERNTPARMSPSGCGRHWAHTRLRTMRTDDRTELGQLKGGGGTTGRDVLLRPTSTSGRHERLCRWRSEYARHIDQCHPPNSRPAHPAHGYARIAWRAPIRQVKSLQMPGVLGIYVLPTQTSPPAQVCGGPRNIQGRCRARQIQDRETLLDASDGSRPNHSSTRRIARLGSRTARDCVEHDGNSRAQTPRFSKSPRQPPVTVRCVPGSESDVPTLQESESPPHQEQASCLYAVWGPSSLGPRRAAAASRTLPPLPVRKDRRPIPRCAARRGTIVIRKSICIRIASRSSPSARIRPKYACPPARRWLVSLARSRFALRSVALVWLRVTLPRAFEVELSAKDDCARLNGRTVSHGCIVPTRRPLQVVTDSPYCGGGTRRAAMLTPV